MTEQLPLSYWADTIRADLKRRRETECEPPPTETDAECCASGRCEVCTPGYDWGRDG